MFIPFRLMLLAMFSSNLNFIFASPSPAPLPMNDGSGGRQDCNDTRLPRINTQQVRQSSSSSNSKTSRRGRRVLEHHSGSQSARADYWSHQQHVGMQTSGRIGAPRQNRHQDLQSPDARYDEGERDVSGRFRRQRSNVNVNDRDDESTTYGESSHNQEYGGIQSLLEHLDPGHPQWQVGVHDSSRDLLTQDESHFHHVNISNTTDHTNFAVPPWQAQNYIGDSSTSSILADTLSTPEYYGSVPYPAYKYETGVYDYNPAVTGQISGFCDNLRSMEGSIIHENTSGQYHSSDMERLTDYTQNMNLRGESSLSDEQLHREEQGGKERESEIQEEDSEDYFAEEEEAEEEPEGQKPRRRRKPFLRRPEYIRVCQYPDRPKAHRRPPLRLRKDERHKLFGDYFSDLVSLHRRKVLHRVEHKVGRDYTQPWEYNLPFENDIVFKPGVIYHSANAALSTDQALVIGERIRRVRAYHVSAISQRMSTDLQEHQARAILYGTVTERENAIQEVFPSEKVRYMLGFAPWMTGMHDDQRIKVIDVLAEATGEASDDLHEAMLNQRITSDEAWRVLNTSMADHLRFAQRRGLYTQRDKFFKNWNKGLSKIQRGALIQRIVNTGVTDWTARKLLTSPCVPEGVGIVLLRAKSETFREIMSFWRNVELPTGFKY
jgi:hypothetical protein